MNKIFAFSIIAVALALMPIHAQTSQFVGAACPPPTAAAPVWGKLVMVGNTVTCYFAKGAATPTTWTQIGLPQTIGFVNDPVLVGIYITAHNAANISTGTIDNVSISPTPKYRLVDSDIGMPAYMGSANLINGVWTITGSGADIWGTSDQFNFQPWLVWGDCTIICRITSLSTVGDVWQKIGIMIRDGYNSGSDNATFCATHAQGVVYQWRSAFSNNPDQIQMVAPPRSRHHLRSRPRLRHHRQHQLHSPAVITCRFPSDSRRHEQWRFAWDRRRGRRAFCEAGRWFGPACAWCRSTHSPRRR